MFDSGERGSDGAQDLLFKHLQEAEVNEECARESACVADEDLRRAWAESFEMPVGAVLWALDSQAAAPALGEEPIRGSLMNVSLVAEFDKEFRKRCAIFLNWKRYRVQGQTVETDESDRLIFSMALRHPYRALPDFGVVMDAGPFSLSRPTVLAHACRLQQMFECVTMGRIWLQKVPMQVQRRTFFGKPWLASEPMRSMPCSCRCAQDATSTRDTRTVLSSAVLGVCFAGIQPVSKRLQEPRWRQVEWPQ